MPGAGARMRPGTSTTGRFAPRHLPGLAHMHATHQSRQKLAEAELVPVTSITNFEQSGRGSAVPISPCTPDRTPFVVADSDYGAHRLESAIGTVRLRRPNLAFGQRLLQSYLDPPLSMFSWDGKREVNVRPASASCIAGTRSV